MQMGQESFLGVWSSALDLVAMLARSNVGEFIQTNSG